MDLSGCAAQKEPQTQEHGTPGQPDSTDRGPEQSQEPNCQCTEGQGSGGAAGEGTHRGIKADEQPGQWENEAESNFRYTCLQNTTKPEVRFNIFILCPLDACLLYSAFLLTL